MCNINLNILNKMRDVNKKYKGKYTYVQLSSDIHSGSDINRLGSDIQSLINLYLFRVFCYFGSDIGSGFSGRVRIRVRISGKMSTPIFDTENSHKVMFLIY